MDAEPSEAYELNGAIEIFPTKAEENFDAPMNAIAEGNRFCDRMICTDLMIKNGALPPLKDRSESLRSCRETILSKIAELYDWPDGFRLIFYVPLRRLERLERRLEALIANRPAIEEASCDDAGFQSESVH